MLKFDSVVAHGDRKTNAVAHAAWRALGVDMEEENPRSAHSLLMSMLDGSNLNVFLAHKRKMSGEVATISSWARTQHNDNARSLALSDLLIFGDNSFREDHIKSKLVDVQDRFPTNEVPNVYCMFLAARVDRFENGKSEVLTIDRFGNVQSEVLWVDVRTPAAWNDKAKAPYLVLAKVVAGPGNTLVWVEAYAQPVVSMDCWVAVDSNLERQAFEAIRKALANQERRAVACFAVKPVFNIPVREGVCRPDFVVHRVGSDGYVDRLVIETKGYGSEEYIQRKGRTHKLMSDVGVVFEDDRFGVPKEKANERLIAFVDQWFESRKAA
jgi:hypothetical protein